jgi:hypothetical protein
MDTLKIDCDSNSSDDEYVVFDAVNHMVSPTGASKFMQIGTHPGDLETEVDSLQSSPEQVKAITGRKKTREYIMVLLK